MRRARPELIEHEWVAPQLLLLLELLLLLLLQQQQPPRRIGQGEASQEKSDSRIPGRPLRIANSLRCGKIARKGPNVAVSPF